MKIGLSQNFVCSKHGLQPVGGLGLTFDRSDLAGVSAFYESAKRRHYCAECLVELLDRNCEQLTPANPEVGP